ncbi:MAG: phosphatidylglycerophosphatase A [Opitutae bacterium]|nr:phosphatidylglycerophosphatase A [Opitutae bacterium]
MQLQEPRWPARLPAKFVTAVATLGPLGRRMPAPGTWGSAAGVLYFLVFFRHARWEVAFTWTLLASCLAVAFTGEAARRMGRTDPGEVILDEFVVMPLVFLGWRAGYPSMLPDWAVLLAGFALFRFYDILKPLGIRRLQRWPGGWGIVVDDFAAALAACATLHLGAWLWIRL